MTEHPYGYIKGDKIYLRGFLGQEDRVIGEVKEDEASTIRYFEDRFETVKQKVAKLKQDIEENQNKGSYLMKLIHLKNSLMNYDGLGDFPGLIRELEEKETFLEEIIQSNRQKNLEIKKALIKEADAIKNSTDWKEASEAFKELKLKWLKTGPVEKEVQDEIEKEFQDILDIFTATERTISMGSPCRQSKTSKYMKACSNRQERRMTYPTLKRPLRSVKKFKSNGRLREESPQLKDNPYGMSFLS